MIKLNKSEKINTNTIKTGLYHRFRFSISISNLKNVHISYLHFSVDAFLYNQLYKHHNALLKQHNDRCNDREKDLVTYCVTTQLIE